MTAGWLAGLVWMQKAGSVWMMDVAEPKDGRCQIRRQNLLRMDVDEVDGDAVCHGLRRLPDVDACEVFCVPQGRHRNKSDRRICGNSF